MPHTDTGTEKETCRNQFAVFIQVVIDVNWKWTGSFLPITLAAWKSNLKAIKHDILLRIYWNHNTKPDPPPHCLFYSFSCGSIQVVEKKLLWCRCFSSSSPGNTNSYSSILLKSGKKTGSIHFVERIICLWRIASLLNWFTSFDAKLISL